MRGCFQGASVKIYMFEDAATETCINYSDYNREYFIKAGFKKLCT